MANRKFFIVNYHNKEHTLKLEKFAIENKNLTLLETLPNILININNNEMSTINELDQIACLEEKNQIVDFCHLHIERDIKSCYLTLNPSSKKSKSRPILTLLEEYAFNVLEMEEVFLKFSPLDKSTINVMLERGFENLGNVNGNIYLLKEKVQKQEIRMEK